MCFPKKRIKHGSLEHGWRPLCYLPDDRKVQRTIRPRAAKLLTAPLNSTENAKTIGPHQHAWKMYKTPVSSVASATDFLFLIQNTDDLMGTSVQVWNIPSPDARGSQVL